MPAVVRILLSLAALLAAVSVALPARAPANWALGPFRRPADAKPVITPDKDSVFLCPVRQTEVRWEAMHTFNPAAVVRAGKIFVLYRAEDDTGDEKLGGHTSRLGLAESRDGIHFTRSAAPVFYPANDAQKAREWPGGCEDPRIVERDDGVYVMTYTQWNQKIWQAGLATSRDLHEWTKYGPLFANAAGGKYAELAYKSAGVVSRLEGDRLIAAKINGKYWMYWGEVEVHLAASDDLVVWTPLEDAQGKLLTVLAARPGRFDSAFPEVGPPPVLTGNGIVVMYNGKNDPRQGDPKLKADTYSTGQALFDSNDPARLLARQDEPFLKPELPFERSGQYTAGTTFAEGLVYFRGKWFLYYGCADSRVGVVVSEQAPGKVLKPRHHRMESH